MVKIDVHSSGLPPLCEGRCVAGVTGLTLPVSVSVPGPDTKLMQNSGRTKFKRTSIDRLMNTLVLWVGHLKPLTFMPYTVTISGLDLSGFKSSFMYLL